MARFVIGPDVAFRLARERVVIGDGHRILAPTLLRSQRLSLLYQAVRRADLTKKDADRRLDYVRGLRIRLLGDRVLQTVAWKIADQVGWSDTYDAEYVALALLQAQLTDAPSAHPQEHGTGMFGTPCASRGMRRRGCCLRRRTQAPPGR